MIPFASGVYAITNNINGKVYIGHTSNLRRRYSSHWANLRNGRHHNTRLQAEWDEFGESNFSFVVRMEAPVSDCAQLERELIASLMGPNCYNWSPGGSTGRPRVDESVRLVQRSVRLKPEHWALLDAMGLPWLREQIDAAGPDPA